MDSSTFNRSLANAAIPGSESCDKCFNVRIDVRKLRATHPRTIEDSSRANRARTRFGVSGFPATAARIEGRGSSARRIRRARLDSRRGMRDLGRSGAELASHQASSLAEKWIQLISPGYAKTPRRYSQRKCLGVLRVLFFFHNHMGRAITWNPASPLRTAWIVTVLPRRPDQGSACGLTCRTLFTTLNPADLVSRMALLLVYPTPASEPPEPPLGGPGGGAKTAGPLPQ